MPQPISGLAIDLAQFPDSPYYTFTITIALIMRLKPFKSLKYILKYIFKIIAGNPFQIVLLCYNSLITIKLLTHLFYNKYLVNTTLCQTL